MSLKLDSLGAIGTLGADSETFAASTTYGMLYALAGNDVLTSAWFGPFVLGSGNDLLTANTGTSGSGIYAYGVEGADTLTGSTGADWLWGGSDGDSLTGGAGDDRLYGDAQDTWLVYCEYPSLALTPGADTLSGGDGNDLLIGGEAADTMSAGAGADLLVWESAAEFGDVLTDFSAAGGDLLFFLNLIVPNGATPNLAAYLSFAASGADTLMFLDRDGAAGSYSPQLVATLTNLALASISPGQVAGFSSTPLYLPQALMSVGSEWADTVTRTLDDLMAGDESTFMPVYTLAGNDTVNTETGGNFILGDGDDRLTVVPNPLLEGGFFPSSMLAAVVDGGPGADTLAGGLAADQLRGGSGADSLSGGAGDDELFGDCGDQRVVFAHDEDTMAAVPGADTLQGGDGTDLILGGGAADRLGGGAGSDLFVWEDAGEFGDTITDFQAGAGGDRLLFNHLIVPQAGLNAAHYVRLQASGADTLVYLDRDAGGTAYAEQLVATLQGVTVAALAASQLPGLTPGLHVLAPRNLAITSEWADTLDLAAAQTGDPVAYHLLGGDDVLTTQQAASYALGDGNDRFTAGTAPSLGALQVNGDTGNDTVTGGAGADDLTGGSGADVLSGSGGNDTLRGDCHDSLLNFCDDAGDGFMGAVAAGAADTLDGGAGDDVLVGGAGADDLTGGTGSDLFVFEDVTEFGDLIRDFTVGAAGDRLLFNGLVRLAPGATVASYVTLVQSGADTQVWLDRDAGGALAPALVATLQNVTATAVVTASQLLLGEEERAAAASPNHAPTGSDAVIPATEDTPAAGSLPPATDDDGDTVSYAKASDPAHGTVAITPQGGYTYTPAANYSGSDSFTYTLSDGHDGSATYTASVTVAAVNDAPGLTTPAALVFNDTAANDIYLLEFNGSLSGSDVDAGAVLTYSLSGGTPADGGSARTGAYGTLGLNAATGAWTFFPDNAAIQALRSTASDTFTVNVSDGSLGASATFTVQVNGVNDTPAWGTALADQSARQGVAFSAQVPAASVTDRDSGDTLSWSASLASGQPLPAWLGFDAASRTFSGTPGASDLTALELRVTATDSGGAGASDTFALTVAANQVVSGSGDSETLVLPLGSGTVNAGAGVDTVALPMFPNVFSLTENAPGRVSGGYAGYSLDLNDVEYVRFGTTFQTTLAISALVNGTAQTQLGRLTDLYLAFFGRAPDVGGLEYWQRVLLQDGADFASISADFAWSTEAQALFPQGGSNKAFVRTVYLNCFGREPDTLGWDWWTAKLDELDPNDPQYLNNRGSFVGEVILGAYAPTSGDTDRNLLTNRHEASMYYANKLSVQPAEGFDAAINALLTHVTDSAVTEDKAEHVIDHVFADPVTLSGVMTDNALFNSLWGA